MIIYKDVYSGDELLTDAFDIKVVDDFFLEVDGKMITVGGEDIDIGGNASAEGGDDDGAEEVVKVCDVVLSGRFQETNFGKKDYIACYKAFMKKTVKHLKQTNPDRVDAFKSAAQKSVKSILTKFDELQFYIGEGEDAFDGQIVLSFWKDGADAPSFWFFKDALDEEKC